MPTSRRGFFRERLKINFYVPVFSVSLQNIHSRPTRMRRTLHGSGGGSGGGSGRRVEPIRFADDLDRAIGSADWAKVRAILCSTSPGSWKKGQLHAIIQQQAPVQVVSTFITASPSAVRENVANSYPLHVALRCACISGLTVTQMSFGCF